MIGFHARQKLQLMAHSTAAYRELGRQVADIKQLPRTEFKETHCEGFMGALGQIASPGRNANAADGPQPAQGSPWVLSLHPPQ